jgi:hypothetical protein
MRKRIVVSGLLWAALAVGCGKKEAAPAAAEVVAAPKPDEPKPDEPRPDEPRPDEPRPDEPRPARSGDSYLVWSTVEGGYKTALVTADGETIKVEATRPQAIMFASDTLFGVEERAVTFREVGCDQFEQDQDGKSWKPGPKKSLPHLVLRGLVGKDAGEVGRLVDAKSGYFVGEPNAEGEYLLVGEHFGRGQSLVGSWAERLLIVDCEGAFSCGAHGDQSCRFSDMGAGTDRGKPKLEEVQAALESETRTMFSEWNASNDEGFVENIKLDHFKLDANKGDWRVDYVYVADVPYVATDNNWSSYTQARSHKAKALPGLGLGELPAAVGGYLKQEAIEGPFGWSAVTPSEVDRVVAAMGDTATLPAAKPAEPPK